LDLAKQHLTSVLVTPQQFLSFIASFKSVFKEKRKSLEEYQRHVSSGLEQISDTLEQVGAMKAKLSIKETQLSSKTAEANEKLEKLIKDQQEAELQKTASLALQKVIGEQEEQIAARKDIVLTELAKVEPLVEQAQESVSSIKRAHLQELKTMQNPPEAVKLTLESVCIMLGHKVDSWRAIQSVARKDDFISSITNYETSQLSRKSREDIENTYMSNKSFSFDVVNRASKACGPLLQWVVAQVGYAGILDKVSPLRQEVLDLETEANHSREEALRVDASLGSLELGINHYREEYAKLIAETEVMKNEMEVIRRRVDRSVVLLQNLSSEKDRWEMSRYVTHNCDF
jgi:dynein heavy chain 1